jgi:predicted RNA-binding Zn ribbon-like protein
MIARKSDGERFPLYGGRPCLNMIATLGHRHDEVPVERSADEQALVAWMAAAGLLPLEVEVKVRAGQLAQFHELREAIYRLTRAAMGVGHRRARDVELVNGWSARPNLAPQLDGTDIVWSWGDRDPVDAVMATLARDAIQLTAEASSGRLKECEHPDCSLLFYDDSQSARRRWCSMDRCGNRAKLAEHRRRARGNSRSSAVLPTPASPRT